MCRIHSRVLGLSHFRRPICPRTSPARRPAPRGRRGSVGSPPRTNKSSRTSPTARWRPAGLWRREVRPRLSRRGTARTPRRPEASCLTRVGRGCARRATRRERRRSPPERPGTASPRARNARRVIGRPIRQSTRRTACSFLKTASTRTTP